VGTALTVGPKAVLDGPPVDTRERTFGTAEIARFTGTYLDGDDILVLADGKASDLLTGTYRRTLCEGIGGARGIKGGRFKNDVSSRFDSRGGVGIFRRTAVEPLRDAAGAGLTRSSLVALTPHVEELDAVDEPEADRWGGPSRPTKALSSCPRIVSLAEFSALERALFLMAKVDSAGFVLALAVEIPVVVGLMELLLGPGGRAVGFGLLAKSDSATRTSCVLSGNVVGSDTGGNER